MAERITNAELARAIARLETESFASMARIEAKVDKALDDHEKRLRRLEGRMYATSGVSAAGGTLVGWLLSLLGG